MSAILVECGFIDSAEDMQRFNAEKMANAIVKGLTGSIVNGNENIRITLMDILDYRDYALDLFLLINGFGTWPGALTAHIQNVCAIPEEYLRLLASCTDSILMAQQPIS